MPSTTMTNKNGYVAFPIGISKNSFGKSSLGWWAHFIVVILRMGAQTKIVYSIVQSVPISVVHFIIKGVYSVVNHPNKTVKEEVVTRSIVIHSDLTINGTSPLVGHKFKPDHFSSHFGILLIGIRNGTEVRKWPPFPSGISCFGIVVNAVHQKGLWRKRLWLTRIFDDWFTHWLYGLNVKACQLLS